MTSNSEKLKMTGDYFYNLFPEIDRNLSGI